MAGEAYYNTGTATVAANSKTVTGTGTNWLSAVGGLTAIKAGDKFGIHVGRPIIIASVDSNTQLTLEDNWPGPAQTNAAYKIELTNPDVIAVEAMRRVLGSLGSGVLYGLSQLPSTPSRLLGIDENGLAALLNSASAYGLLGTIPNAQIPTRLQAQPATVSAANALDNITETGWASVSGGNVVTVGGPAAGGAGICFTEVYDANAAFQRYSSVGVLDREWIRRKSAGVWSTWTPSVVGDVTNASTLATGEIADVVLPQSLKNAGMLTAEIQFTDFAQLNALSVTGATKTQSGNNLILTATTNDPQILFNVNRDGNRTRYVAFRYKRNSGTLDGTVFYTTSGHGESSSYTKKWMRDVLGQWNTVVLDMWELTAGGTDWKDNTIVTVRVDIAGSTGAEIELAWIGVYNDAPAISAQSSATDTRAGAAMIVGAFGLGSTGTLLTSTDDLNSLPDITADYRWGSTSVPTNAPEAGSFILEQKAFGVGVSEQTACNLSTGTNVWYRKEAGGVWTSWTRIDGDVSGPTVAIDNAPVGFSGTSGKSIKQLTGPVAALHAVTGAANKLPYFTGAAAMATTDLTAFARTVLDDDSGAAMFATMGATFSGSSAAGSAKLPSGLELKWGTSVNSLSDYRLLFPIAFANDCFVALPVNTFDYGGAADRFIGVSTSNVDRNGFDIRARNITNGGGVAGQGNVPVRWLAVGW